MQDRTSQAEGDGGPGAQGQASARPPDPPGLGALSWGGWQLPTCKGAGSGPGCGLEAAGGRGEVAPLPRCCPTARGHGAALVSCPPPAAPSPWKSGPVPSSPVKTQA